MAKHHLYDESPAIKHDEAGHTKVEKKKPPTAGKEEKGVEAEGFPMHVKHAHERHSMYARHSMEHGVHDAGNNGEKKEMHGRHEKEMSAMHTRHEKEAGATSEGGEPVKKIEKETKHG